MRLVASSAAPAVCSVLLLHGWGSHAFSPSTDSSRMPATTTSCSSSSAVASSALFATGNGRRASSASNAIAKAKARREAKARQAANATASKSVTAKSDSTSANILNKAMQQSRDTILGRDGEHFAFDRIGGKVEFGSTADLVTPLETEGVEPNAESVGLWLSDARRVAGGLWDEDLLSDLGQCTYRLGLMPLKFVTIELAPTVDVKMWTDGTMAAEDAAIGAAHDATPTFRLHSIGFEPNVTLLPGVGLDAKSLGIEIEVCGELRPTADGKGCEGQIGFVSRGELPPPMRVLPDSVISAAGATISKTVRDFAVANFQAGAVKQYRAFCLEQSSLAAAESRSSVVAK